MTTTTAKRATLAPVRAVLYLRLSDLRPEDLDEHGRGKTFTEREKSLRKFAQQLGWPVVKVIVENDLVAGKRKNASAFKRRKVTLPDGSTGLRVYRPGYRSILNMLMSGEANAFIAEDLDRTVRDPRDLEDLIDIAEAKRINARSPAGSLTFTDGGTDAEITMARLMVAIANKSSRDTSRRVRDAMERLVTNGKSHGGPRRFGWEPDGLTLRPAEAKILDDMSRRVVLSRTSPKGNTLRALVRELKEGDVSPQSGTEWNSTILREYLLRPRNAGILVFRGEEIGPAPWQAAVDEHLFREVVEILTDPARRLGPGATPKYLGTNIFRCGKCTHMEAFVFATYHNKRPAYRCKEGSHCTRRLDNVDKYVRETIFARLSKSDAVDLFASTPAPDIDVAALRAEARRINETIGELANDRVLGLIDRAQMLSGTAAGKKRLAEIDDLLATTIEDSPVAKLVTADDVAAAFDAAPLATRRTIIDQLVTVWIMPATKRGGTAFDPLSVVIKWKNPAANAV